jgi:transposase InsO family protein
MKVHANAALGPAGRLALVEAIESGMTQKAAAAAFCVAPATAHRWWHRRLDASAEEVQIRCCASASSSRGLRWGREERSSSQLPEREWRERTGWGPRLVAGKVGRHHSTVWKVLARHGISRPPRAPREEARRYEWPCPGDLLHMDTSRYARFERPGHAVTGDRSQRSRKWMDPTTRVGYDFCHAIVDDHSRLAYVELHPDERAATVTGFVERALEFFGSHGISTKRLMTDNAFAYVKNRSLRELLASREVKHITTQPYRPQTNGKVERFHQTMAREWAYGMAYRSHRHRNRALPRWLGHYNETRPHSSLGGRPPLSRVHNVRGQDS